MQLIFEYNVNLIFVQKIKLKLIDQYSLFVCVFSHDNVKLFRKEVNTFCSF